VQVRLANGHIRGEFKFKRDYVNKSRTVKISRWVVQICFETRLISICFCLILFSVQLTIWSISCLFSNHSLRLVPWHYISRAANKTGACGTGTMLWWALPLLFISGCSNSSSRCLHTLLQEFFLFLKVKEHPAGIPLTQDTFRSNLERAVRTIAI
jgi:hypothetical protein